MIKIIAIIILCLTLATVRAQQATVTLTNPISLTRPDEPIAWQRSALEKKLGVIPAGKYLQVTTSEGRPVPVQLDDLDGDGQWDEVFFLRNFGPGEKMILTISVADAPATVKIAVRAHVRMRPKNADDSFGADVDSAVMPGNNPATDFSTHRLPSWLTEGPAWENDKVAYRLYFDTRNGKDIYGKRIGVMVMDEVGANPDKSYHELADWGMDILKVGGSLGAGALAVFVPGRAGTRQRDTLIRLGGLQVRRETFRKLSDGPLRAIFRMSYEWEIAGTPVTIAEEITIAAGQYCYGSKVTIQGAPPGARLVTGIANFYTNEPGNFSKGRSRVLYSYGKQSENKDLLGMGILVGNTNFAGFRSLPASGGEVTSTYTVSQYIRQEKPLYFLFYTGWEKTDPGFASGEYFINMLRAEADKFNHPINTAF